MSGYSYNAPPPPPPWQQPKRAAALPLPPLNTIDSPAPSANRSPVGNEGQTTVLFPAEMTVPLLALAELQLLNLLSLQTLLRQGMNLPDRFEQALAQHCQRLNQSVELEEAQFLLALLAEPAAATLPLEPLKAKLLHHLSSLTNQFLQVMAHNSGPSGYANPQGGGGTPQQDLMALLSHWQGALGTEHPHQALSVLLGLYLPPFTLQPPYQFRFEPPPQHPSEGSDLSQGGQGAANQESVTLYLSMARLGTVRVSVSLMSAVSPVQLEVVLDHEPVITPKVQTAIETQCQTGGSLPQAIAQQLTWVWLPRPTQPHFDTTDNPADESPAIANTKAKIVAAPVSAKVSPLVVMAAFAVAHAIVTIDQAMA